MAGGDGVGDRPGGCSEAESWVLGVEEAVRCQGLAWRGRKSGQDPRSVGAKVLRSAGGRNPRGKGDSWQKKRRCAGVGSCWCAASWRRRRGWESMKNGGGDTAVGRRLSCARGSRERKSNATQQYTRTKTKEIGVRQQKMMDRSKSIHHQHLHPFAVESV